MRQPTLYPHYQTRQRLEHDCCRSMGFTNDNARTLQWRDAPAKVKRRCRLNFVVSTVRYSVKLSYVNYTNVILQNICNLRKFGKCVRRSKSECYSSESLLHSTLSHSDDKDSSIRTNRKRILKNLIQRCKMCFSKNPISKMKKTSNCNGVLALAC